MTTPAGPAPKANAQAPSQPDYLERARELEADAQQFIDADLPTWSAAVDALDLGHLDQSVNRILQRWSALNAARSALYVPPLFRPPELDRADHAVDVAHDTIGNVVTLQHYSNQPVLGHELYFPVPADPTAFVLEQQQTATDVIGRLIGLVSVLSTPTYGLGLKDEQVADVLLQLRQLTTEMAYDFVLAVLKAKKLDKAALSSIMTGDAGKDVLSLHKKLKDLAVITHDGLDGAPAADLNQMQRDADELDEAVHRWIVSDDHVNRILAHYPDEAQRELFFKLLEHRNLLDAILHRADTKHVEGELHETKGFEQREYNATFNTSRSIGEQAKYVGAEMARQTPGALCHFASGVFKGLSKIPVIGGVFARSSSAFAELGDAADLATGAWTDKTAMAWRNGLSEVAGTIDGALLVDEAGSELTAGETLGAVDATKNAIEAGMDAKNVADTIYSLVDAYHDANIFWKTAVTTFDYVPRAINDAVHGDPAAAIGDVSSMFDGLLANLTGSADAKWTEKGQDAAKKTVQASIGRDEHTAALRAFSDLTRSMAAKGQPTEEDVNELSARSKAVQRAALDNQHGGPADLAPAPRAKPEGFKASAKHWLGQFVRGELIKLLALAIEKLKGAVVEALQAHFADQKPPRPGAPAPQPKLSLGDRLVEKIDGLKPTLANAATGGLAKGVTAGVTFMINKAVPSWPKDVVEMATERLVEMGNQVLDVDHLLEEPLGKLTHEIARTVVGDIPALHLSPEAAPEAAPADSANAGES